MRIHGRTGRHRRSLDRRLRHPRRGDRCVRRRLDRSGHRLNLGCSDPGLRSRRRNRRGEGLDLRERRAVLVGADAGEFSLTRSAFTRPASTTPAATATSAIAVAIVDTGDRGAFDQRTDRLRRSRRRGFLRPFGRLAALARLAAFAAFALRTFRALGTFGSLGALGPLGTRAVGGGFIAAPVTAARFLAAGVVTAAVLAAIVVALLPARLSRLPLRTASAATGCALRTAAARAFAALVAPVAAFAAPLVTPSLVATVAPLAAALVTATAAASAPLVTATTPVTPGPVACAAIARGRRGG